MYLALYQTVNKDIFIQFNHILIFLEERGLKCSNWRYVIVYNSVLRPLSSCLWSESEWVWSFILQAHRI